MKTASILITTLLSLVLSLTTSAQGAATLLTKIVEISPAQASAGQTITVRVESASITGIAQKFSIPQLSKFRRAVIPTVGSSTPRIFFTGSTGQQNVEAQNVVSLGNNRYSLRVPSNARSGKLRYQVGGASSLSTPTFTLVTTGYTFVNFGQFNITSIKIDNVERLGGQIVQATLPTDPNVFLIDIGATSGNHSMQVTVGRSAAEPVMVYFLPSVAATSPFNQIEVGTMLAGEYLTASPNATVQNNVITSSWQTLIVGANGNVSVNGFDFSFNMATNTTTWKHWIGDRPNVAATGSMAEPTSWPLNPATMTLALRTSNNALYSNITVNLLNKTMLAADGNSYELQ